MEGVGGAAQCVICFAILAVKGSNVKRHCESKHPDQLALPTEFERRKKQLLSQRAGSQALSLPCAKSETFVDAMNVVVKTVNFVLKHALNHRQFKALLEEAEAEFGDLTYFCEVRWLSRGNMLERVFALREELSAFMQAKKRPVAEFDDPTCVCDLAFLVDLTKHLNELNKTLQGRDVLLPDLLARVKAFEAKLTQLMQQKLSHFHNVQKLGPFVENTQDVFAQRILWSLQGGVRACEESCSFN
jgi:hypothetical protein